MVSLSVNITHSIRHFKPELILYKSYENGLSLRKLCIQLYFWYFCSFSSHLFWIWRGGGVFVSIDVSCIPSGFCMSTSELPPCGSSLSSLDWGESRGLGGLLARRQGGPGPRHWCDGRLWLKWAAAIHSAVVLSHTHCSLSHTVTPWPEEETDDEVKGYEWALQVIILNKLIMFILLNLVWVSHRKGRFFGISEVMWTITKRQVWLSWSEFGWAILNIFIALRLRAKLKNVSG